jgi:hypothetical protein
VTAIVARLDARRALLAAHAEMIEEALARGDDQEGDVQIALLLDELAFLRDLCQFLVLDGIRRELLAGGDGCYRSG